MKINEEIGVLQNISDLLDEIRYLSKNECNQYPDTYDDYELIKMILEDVKESLK